MKLKGHYSWAPWVIFIVCGLSLALILAFVSGVLFATGLQWEYVYFIDLLIGIFIVGGIGLVVVEKSRYIGTLMIAIYIPALIYFSIITHRIIPDALYIGLGIGIAVTVGFIYLIRFDWLARTMLYLMFGFVVIFIGYLISVILENYSRISAQGTLVYFIVAIILTISLFFFISRNLHAVTSSDVLIIGPQSSGKSYVIAALALHLSRQNRAVARSFIFSPNEDAGERLTIQNIATKYQRGKEKLEPTNANELAYYQFNGKKWGIIPVRVTCLDYAGGLIGGRRFNLINEQNYENKVILIAQIMGKTPTEVMRDFGDIRFFWNEFYQHYRSDFYATFDDIVPAFIYARLLKAGKIVFLIDGAKLLSSSTQDPEWDNYLSNILRLVQSLGDDKDYAFAITKADLIPDIKDLIRGEKKQDGEVIPGIPEDSQRAGEIEQSKIKELFANNFHLNSIYNAIMKDSFIRLQYIEGFLISVDCSPRPSDKQDIDVTGEHPWRIKEIARYIMKF